VPTSEKTAQSWKYTTNTPVSSWNTAPFDDSSWKTGNGGFGTTGTPAAVIGTAWNTSDIWLRRTFDAGSLTPAQVNSLILRLHHDEDVEIYVNGVQAAKVTGYVTSYEFAPIATAAQNAFVVSGSNVLAAHCHNTVGGQYIDVGVSLRDL
jgi:hypothetical protein